MTAKKKYPIEWDKNTILGILQDIDAYFVKKKEKVTVTAIGGIAIVLQDFQPRSTNDMDVAPILNAERFLDACKELKISAQIVTLVSTVDFQDVQKITLFSGNALTLYGVGAEDLIRMKLERFRRHDPEDIYAIIQKSDFSYDQFAELVNDAKSYFIGRVEEYLVSAQLVVERMYPDKFAEFSQRFRIS